jgi:hypothetical protein
MQNAWNAKRENATTSNTAGQSPTTVSSQSSYVLCGITSERA